VHESCVEQRARAEQQQLEGVVAEEATQAVAVEEQFGLAKDRRRVDHLIPARRACLRGLLPDAAVSLFSQGTGRTDVPNQRMLSDLMEGDG
jgi:hypothetical protein